MSTPQLTQVERDYVDGKWVPSYYGLKFTVARNVPSPASDQDRSFIVPTLAEAQAEASRRNATGGAERGSK